MGMGIAGRFFQGIRSAVNTVSVAEAHMAQAKKVEGPKTFPELGVLQFGSRFRSMEGVMNPFTSGVRPATGPSVSRPGNEMFKGTGGAFAPEQTLQMTSGIGNMGGTLGQLAQFSNVMAGNPTLQATAAPFQQFNAQNMAGLDVASPQQMQNALDSAGVPPDQQQFFFLQQQMQQLDRLFQLVTTMKKAEHDIAMNSIRNLKG